MWKLTEEKAIKSILRSELYYADEFSPAIDTSKLIDFFLHSGENQINEENFFAVDCALQWTCIVIVFDRSMLYK